MTRTVNAFMDSSYARRMLGSLLNYSSTYEHPSILVSPHTTQSDALTCLKLMCLVFTGASTSECTSFLKKEKKRTMS